MRLLVSQRCEDRVKDGLPQLSVSEVKQLERAATHQVQALARLRQARDPAKRQSTARRYRLLLDVLEHLVVAQHLLERVRQAAINHPDLATSINAHINGLTTLREQTEQLIETNNCRVTGS